MRALIVGTGFIGNALANRLDEVVTISRFRPPKHSKKHYYVDAKDWHKVLDIIQTEDIDTVFHMAAVSTVGLAHKAPLEAVYETILSAAGVLEASRRANVKRVIIMGTDKEYGEVENADENAPLARNSGIYGTAKLSASLLALAYRQEYGLPVTVVRSVNVYGPGDENLTRIIPRAIYYALTNKTFPVYGEGVRSYVFIDDLLDALLLIKDHPEYDVVNVCGDTKSNIEVVQEIKKNLPNLKYEIVSKPYPEISKQSLVCKRLESLGWRRKVSFEEGIKLTIEWWLAHLRPTVEVALSSS